MFDSTPAPEEGAPPSDSTERPSEEPTDTVESLKERLAAEQKEKENALEEAKRWKNRVKEENPPKEKKETDEDYLDWKIDNTNRIKLVKEQYETELSELQEGGAKLSNTMREKALKLAEASLGVKKADSTEPLPGPSIDRGGQREPKLTVEDAAFGIKPETKKKYAHLESQW